jgi:hypothetical protein
MAWWNIAGFFSPPGVPFTLLRFRHWRAAPNALEAEQIDRVRLR